MEHRLGHGASFNPLHIILEGPPRQLCPMREPALSLAAMHGTGRIALGISLAIFCCNAALYLWRAMILRQVEACDHSEKLGLLDGVWAFAKECAAILAVLVLIPIGWMLSRCRPGRGDRGPLILTHGWALNRGSLALLRIRLLRDGWGPVCCFEYRSARADVERAPRSDSAR